MKLVADKWKKFNQICGAAAASAGPRSESEMSLDATVDLRPSSGADRRGRARSQASGLRADAPDGGACPRLDGRARCPVSRIEVPARGGALAVGVYDLARLDHCGGHRADPEKYHLGARTRPTPRAAVEPRSSSGA